MASEGDLYIDAHHHDDGDPTFVNDIEPEFITCRFESDDVNDEVIVWQKNVGPILTPPSAIIDFVASDNLVEAVRCTWSVASGNPTPTYNLYRSGVLFKTGAVSGETHGMGAGTYPFYVKAVNPEGSEDSNTNNGTAKAPAVPPPSGSKTFTAAGNHSFTVPAGVYRLTLRMIGGGGAGGGVEYTHDNYNPSAGGGYAGNERVDTYNVTPGQVMALTVGVGGRGLDSPGSGTYHGKSGSPSSWGSIVANGGGGGAANSLGGVGYYLGNSGGHGDGARSVYTITATWTAWGGQGSSVGSGGRGYAHGRNSGNAGNGGQASGGGGSSVAHSLTSHSGSGGPGYIRVSW